MVLTTGFLRGPVGAGLENDPQDVIGVKRRLRDIGLYRPPPEGMGDDIDAEFEKAVRAFQESAGLRVDGLLEPGGETERNLAAVMTGEGFDPPPAPEEFILRGGVGAGGDNEPEDIAVVKRALGAIGAYPYDRTRPPPPYIDRKLVDAIRSFQRDRGLHDDGLIDTEGKTLQALRAATTERQHASAADGSAPRPPDETDETKVAALPAALLPAVPWLLQAGRTALPHVSRILGGATGGVAAQTAIDAAKKDSEAKFESTPPLPPEPPPSPGELKPPEIEGFPAEPPQLPEDSSFPEPVDPRNLIEIFPDQSDEFSGPIIVEHRGNERTRSLNSKIRDVIERIAERHSLSARHTGGARDRFGKERTETYLKEYRTQGRKGSSRTDITFTSDKTGRRLFVNSTDTLADRSTPNKREREAGIRIILNGETGDLLVQIGKLAEGQTLDETSLEEFLKPLLDEIDKPAPETDHRQPDEIQKRIHIFGGTR